MLPSLESQPADAFPNQLYESDVPANKKKPGKYPSGLGAYPRKEGELPDLNGCSAMDGGRPPLASSNCHAMPCQAPLYSRPAPCLRPFSESQSRPTRTVRNGRGGEDKGRLRSVGAPRPPRTSRRSGVPGRVDADADADGRGRSGSLWSGSVSGLWHSPQVRQGPELLLVRRHERVQHLQVRPGDRGGTEGGAVLKARLPLPG